MFPAIIPDVIMQHAAEVPILLRMRKALLSSPVADLGDLAGLDAQITANLEGLALAGSVGWDMVHERFVDDPEGPTVFALAYLANVGDRKARVPQLLAALANDPTLTEGAALGLCWHGATRARELAKRLLTAPTPEHHALALACCLTVGLYPSDAICTHLSGPPSLRVWALRLAGWGNVSAAASLVAAPLADDDAACQLARATASVLLAAPLEAVATLQTFAAETDDSGLQARRVLAVTLGAQEMADWVAAPEGPANPDQKIETAGFAGYPALVPWLVDCAGHDAFQEIAEDSIAQITGVRLSEAFEDDAPPVAANPFASGPAAPLLTQAEKVAAWWPQAQDRFGTGPCLHGKAVAQMDITTCLQTAALADRALIALRARKTFGQVPQWQTDAPAFVQKGLA